MEEKFYEWMMDNTKLSDSSCRKYKRAVVTLSKLAIEEELTKKQLYGCNFAEYVKVKVRIFENDSFINKNTVGNRMYSRALEYYEQFLKENS